LKIQCSDPFDDVKQEPNQADCDNGSKGMGDGCWSEVTDTIMYDLGRSYTYGDGKNSPRERTLSAPQVIDRINTKYLCHINYSVTGNYVTDYDYGVYTNIDTSPAGVDGVKVKFCKSCALVLDPDTPNPPNYVYKI
jgi:hypothetical protein